MKTTTITVNDFLNGSMFLRPTGTGQHNLTAKWDNGIKVTDENGNAVNVEYGATTDNRTVTAYVREIGFIGGWQYPHKRQSFKLLIDSINQGIVYHDMNDLPNGRKRKH